MSTLTEAVRAMNQLRDELKAHETAAAKRSEDLKREIRAKALILENAAEGLDTAKLTLAQTVIRVSGSYERGGEDRGSVIADAINQIATGEPVRRVYGDLWHVEFGTKNYDRWQGQRSDHPYGYGPTHGSTVFSVGFTEAVRIRDPKQLTPEEAEAAIYYLTNIQRVQKAAARSQVAS